VAVDASGYLIFNIIFYKKKTNHKWHFSNNILITLYRKQPSCKGHYTNFHVIPNMHNMCKFPNNQQIALIFPMARPQDFLNVREKETNKQTKNYSSSRYECFWFSKNLMLIFLYTPLYQYSHILYC
jgi:hypothetical protein